MKLNLKKNSEECCWKYFEKFYLLQKPAEAFNRNLLDTALIIAKKK